MEEWNRERVSDMMTGKKRILLVDDDESFTRVLKIGLETAGYEVCTENQASRALPVARAFKPDVIVLDINMPEKDGVEVSDDLREDEEMGNVPVIFLSGLLDEKDVARFEKLGATALCKPVALVDLTHCIEERLGTP